MFLCGRLPPLSRDWKRTVVRRKGSSMDRPLYRHTYFVGGWLPVTYLDECSPSLQDLLRTREADAIRRYWKDQS